MKLKPILFSALATGLLFPFVSFGYEIETHAYLAEKTIEFYNDKSANKIPGELAPFFIDGVRREDDVPRWMNHFYDPVKNRGLSYDAAIDPSSNLGTWAASKEWVNNSENQNQTKYKVPATIASILTAIQQRRISEITSETNFTWDKALRLYIKGDKEEAIFALGHVVHLIQDLSVPDHTRNDPHPGDSFYEKYSQQNPPVDNLNDKDIPRFDSLAEYFENIAKYTNTHFYSKDTIGIQSGYNLPEVDQFENKNGYSIALGKDEDGYYPLFKKSGNKISAMSSEDLVILRTDDIQGAYWNRLAPKAVQYGAGVVDFFFKEAERLKDDEEFLAKGDKSLFASFLALMQDSAEKVGSVIKGLFPGKGPQNSASVPEGGGIPLEEERRGDSEGDGDLDEGEFFSEAFPETATSTEEPPETAMTSIDIATTTATTTLASTTLTASSTVPTLPKLGDFSLRINEILYDAPGSDEDKEWIEIYHTGGDPVDLTRLFFEENKTKHKIEFFSGTTTLQYGDYAVIAENPEEFLKSNYKFPGNLFRSAMSLSNSGEELNITDGKKTYSSITYSPVWGGKGDGKSLQYLGVAWEASIPTPGWANARMGSSGGGSANISQSTEFVVDESTSSAGEINHVVVSEVLFDAVGGDEGKEFIELYNHSSIPLDLNKWSIKYQIVGSEDFQSLITFNPSRGDKTTIAPYGYLLVGLNGYNASSYENLSADAVRSASLPNGTSDMRITLFDTDDFGVDEVFYNKSSIFSEGQSIERRAFADGICFSPQKSGEYLGNGCDTGAPWDFVARQTPKPQNSQNLIEPRLRPGQPTPRYGETIIGEYKKDSISIAFSWDDVTPNTPGGTMLYRIIQKNDESWIPIIATTTTAYSMRINSVGKEYEFEITAEDAEGYTSTSTRFSVTIPGFLDRMSVYPDPRPGKENKYVADMYYDAFPFFPSIYGQNAWQGMVIYRNRLPNEENISLSTTNNLIPGNTEGVVPIIYSRCVTGTSDSREYSIIFPLLAEMCGVGGGLHSSSLDFTELEDKHLLVNFSETSNETSIAPSDYFTVAFYDFQSSGAGAQNLALVAIDETKYSFTQSPASQAFPVLSGGLGVNFSKDDSRIRLALPTVSDSDTLDKNLVWESNYSPAGIALDEMLWTPIETSRLVASGDSFLIGVRVKDDFGNLSETMTAEWAYPTSTEYIAQAFQNGQSDVFGSVSQAGRFTDPDSAGFQSFSPEEDFSFDLVTVKLFRTLGSDQGTARISVFASNEDGTIDNSMLLGEAAITLYSALGEEYTFEFSSPISVHKDNVYWLAIDVSGYWDNRGYFRNEWRNAIQLGDSYSRGSAYKGFGSGMNADTSMFVIVGNYSSGPADWWFKINKKAQPQ